MWRQFATKRDKYPKPVEGDDDEENSDAEETSDED
jgi:hypothetical protein